MPSMEEYAYRSNAIGIAPKSQFEHKAGLLQREEGDIKKFYQMARKEMLLANIDKKLVRFKQNKILILTELFSVVQRDISFYPVFEMLYEGFLLELGLTRAIGGEEIHAQHGAVTDRGMDYMPEDLRREEEGLLGKYRNQNQQQGQQQG